jgi:hypothetical protein
MDKHIPITRTGPMSTLGGYARMGELFLTAQITGAEADQIKELMRQLGAEIFIARMRRWAAQPEGNEPPAMLDPLRTDQVWRYTVGNRSPRHRAGRMGYALVRGGVLICELSPSCPGLAPSAVAGGGPGLPAQEKRPGGARAGRSSHISKLAEVT